MKAKYIVFEGIDCCGKTTLIDNVVSAFNLRTVPDHYPRRNFKSYHNAEEILQELADHRYKSGLHFVDRYWPSTIVYQRINYSLQEMQERLPIDALIILSIDQETWTKRIKQRKDDWFTPDKIKDFKEYDDLYRDLAKQDVTFPILHLDIKNVPTHEQLKSVYNIVSNLL